MKQCFQDRETVVTISPSSVTVFVATLKNAKPKATDLDYSNAFEQLAPRVRAYLAKRGAQKEDAEEMTQEVFTRLFEHWSEFKDWARLESWVWRTAKNLLTDHYRWRSTRAGTQSMSDLTLLEEATAYEYSGVPAELAEFRGAVRALFREFSVAHPNRAQALVMSEVEQYSTREIADSLKRSPGATRQYLTECRKAARIPLRQCLSLLPSQCTPLSMALHA